MFIVLRRLSIQVLLYIAVDLGIHLRYRVLQRVPLTSPFLGGGPHCFNVQIATGKYHCSSWTLHVLTTTVVLRSIASGLDCVGTTFSSVRKIPTMPLSMRDLPNDRIIARHLTIRKHKHSWRTPISISSKMGPCSCTFFSSLHFCRSLDRCDRGLSISWTKELVKRICSVLVSNQHATDCWTLTWTPTGKSIRLLGFWKKD